MEVTNNREYLVEVGAMGYSCLEVKETVTTYQYYNLQSQIFNWNKAKKYLKENKTIYFHYQGKVVPISNETDIFHINWCYYGLFGLTIKDIHEGRFSLIDSFKN